LLPSPLFYFLIAPILSIFCHNKAFSHAIRKKKEQQHYTWSILI
jgi:hypothetical protein